MKSNLYNNLITTIISLFCFINSEKLSAQWTSKIPQTVDTLWVDHNQIINANTVWMGGEDLIWDTSFGYWDYGSAVYCYNTIDGGTNWKSVKIPFDPNRIPTLNAINGINGNLGWAAVYGIADGTNDIYRTINGGVNWTQMATTTFTDPNSFVNGILFKDSLNGIMIGDPIPYTDTNFFNFEIYSTTDGGVTWLRISETKIPDLLLDEHGVIKSSKRIGNKIWFSTDQGRIIYSNDGGQNWKFSMAGTGYTAFLDFVDTLHGICASADTTISTKGSLEIKYTSDGGLTWQYAKSPYKDSTYFWALTMIPQSYYLLTNNSITLEGGPFKTWLSKDKGVTWIEIGQDDGLSGIKFLSPSVGYAGEGLSRNQNHGTKIFKYAGNPLMGLLTPNALIAEFAVYPNPVADKLTIDINLAKPSPLMLLINSVDGKLVWNRKIESAVSLYHDECDLNFLSPGTYTITVSGPDGHLSKTFIKH